MAIDLTLKGIENGFRLLVPLALMAVLFLFSVTAFPWSGVGLIKPQLVLIAVYYWAIYRPTLVPPYLCFFLGLLIDVISGLPLGINAIILTLVQWVVRDQRKFLMAQAHITLWAVFILISFSALAIEWAMFGLVDGTWPPFMPIMLSCVATIFLFPLVTFLLVMTHRFLPTVQNHYGPS